MRNQPSKKAIVVSALLTALILVGMVGTRLSAQGWNLALTNPNTTAQATTDTATSDPMALDSATATDTALDPALEAAIDASLDPNMDPALKESLKSALRSALSPQSLTKVGASAQEPAFVVTVEPIFLPGQQQAALSGAQWGGQAAAPAPAAVAASSPSTDLVAAAYQAQLEQAYAALQDAYTQIDTLQSAPATTVSYSGGYEDHDDDHDDHDEHEEHEEHDDD